jgi:hypothetical protein
MLKKWEISTTERDPRVIRDGDKRGKINLVRRLTESVPLPQPLFE